jgi:hypothetical protein
MAQPANGGGGGVVHTSPSCDCPSFSGARIPVQFSRNSLIKPKARAKVYPTTGFCGAIHHGAAKIASHMQCVA